MNPEAMVIEFPNGANLPASVATLDPESGWVSEDADLLNHLIVAYPYPPIGQRYDAYIPYPVDYVGNQAAIALGGVVTQKPKHAIDPNILY